MPSGTDQLFKMALTGEAGDSGLHQRLVVHTWGLHMNRGEDWIGQSFLVLFLKFLASASVSHE